jgi:hypothetical protein
MIGYGIIRMKHLATCLAALIFFTVVAGMPKLFADPIKRVPLQVRSLEAEGRPFRVVKPFLDGLANAELPVELQETSVVFHVDTLALHRISKDRPALLEVILPAPDGQLLHLRLYRVHPFREAAMVRYSDDRPAHLPEGAFYRGMIAGDDHSLVALSFYRDHMRGFVSHQGGNLVLGPLEATDARGMHVCYDDRSIAHLNPLTCGLEVESVPYGIQPGPSEPPGRASDCVSMYWEVDFDIYQNKGSNTASYISGMAHEIYTLFANDGITLETSQIFIWSNPSPYTGPTDLQFLTQFRNQYNGNFFGDLGHLVNYKGSGGIAYLGGLCNPPSNCAFSTIGSSYQNVPTYSWTINVTAHEIGHNLGSPHTHACAWNGNDTRIDNCGGNAGYPEGNCNSNPPNPVNGGTVMSYCHLVAGVGINFNEGFGQQPALLMFDNINGAFCLQGCGNPPPCSFFLVCPPNITMECDADLDPVFTGEPLVELTGNCDQDPLPDWMDLTQGLNGCNGTGTLLRTWIATEEGFTASCTQTITLVDTTPPEFEFIQPDITIACYENVPEPASLALDNCGQPNVFVNEVIQAGNCLYNYVVVRTYQAWDNCSNVTSAVQTITVQDRNAPVFAPGNSPQFVYDCGDVVPVVQPEVYDSCAVVTLSFTDKSLPSGNCPLERFVRTWTATDQCNNTATFEVMIEWTDQEAPEARCRPDTVLLATGDPYVLDPEAFNAGSFDACTQIALRVEPDAVDCSLLGLREMLLIVSDACDNRDTCTTFISVIAPIPMASAVYDVIGPGHFQFDASASEGQIFHWDFGDGETGSEVIEEHTFSAEGSYTVTLVVEDTVCQLRDTLSFGINVILSSSQVPDVSAFRLYPNPGNGVFHLEWDNGSFPFLTLEVINALGQTVLSSRSTLSPAESFRRIDLSGHPAGTYYLILRTSHGIRRLPLVLH